jgi:hypothetical protein
MFLCGSCPRFPTPFLWKLNLKHQIIFLEKHGKEFAVYLSDVEQLEIL